jgi:hypothetical protein
MGHSLRLQIRPIPKPLHGINLRTTLGKYRWKQLRQSITAERDLCCDTCGKKVESYSALSGHEEWTYDTSQTPAVARVKGILLSCWHCHACDHFPLTLILEREGQITAEGVEEAIAHFCAVNHVGRDGFEQHLRAAMAEWDRLSELEWRVDFGPFAGLVDEQRTALRLEHTRFRADPVIAREPFDNERVEAFLGELEALSERYGYWIGRPSKQRFLPLHVRPTGPGNGQYECTIAKITPLVPPDHPGAGVRMELILSWDADPIARSKPKSGGRK